LSAFMKKSSSNIFPNLLPLKYKKDEDHTIFSPSIVLSRVKDK